MACERKLNVRGMKIEYAKKDVLNLNSRENFTNLRITSTTSGYKLSVLAIIIIIIIIFFNYLKPSLISWPVGESWHNDHG